MATTGSLNMGIVMPVPSSPGTDPGPGYATTINNALMYTVDKHSHVPGSGSGVPIAAVQLMGPSTLTGLTSLSGSGGSTTVSADTGSFPLLYANTLGSNLTSSVGTGITLSAPTGSFPVANVNTLNLGGGVSVLGGTI